ncbi:MAG: NAD-dependent epimerase/dehydratase family protein [Gemmatimonadota bacterium]
MGERETEDGVEAGRPVVAERTLTTAVVGAGPMAQHHLRAILRIPQRPRVLGVVDPTPAARERLRQAFPDLDTFESLEDLLAVSVPDVLHVCTPPEAHERAAEMALRSGCHAYVEKPVCETAAGARRLVDLARERGRILCPGHQLLFEPAARRLTALAGTIGHLQHVESYFSFRTVRTAAGGRTPIRDDMQLLDVLPHPVYLLLHWLGGEYGEPARISSIERGPGGTIHALVSRGQTTGVLVVTLDGRPVESYVRLVGTNGTLHADFVRGTVQRLVGPGVSTIDKLLNPYRLARQLGFGTTASLGRRLARRQRSYPGLVEIFTAFYRAVLGNGSAPIEDDEIVETVALCEEVAAVLRSPGAAPSQGFAGRKDRILVTGGTGFFGRSVVQALTSRGRAVRVVARRSPPPWERLAGVEYVEADLAEGVSGRILEGCAQVIHCAAATSGGWAEHQRNSLDATENLVRAAAAAGVGDFVHVSSLAVVEAEPGRPVREDSPLLSEARGSGPYAWGKLASEEIVTRLGAETGIRTIILRPGAIIDFDDLDPPGRLGRRMGNLFVAVGSRSEPLGVVDRRFAAAVVATVVENPDRAPAVLHVLAPRLPTKRELVGRLRERNPDLRVVWLPWLLLGPLSLTASLLQRILRPGSPPVSLVRVFRRETFDTEAVRRLTSPTTG